MNGEHLNTAALGQEDIMLPEGYRAEVDIFSECGKANEEPDKREKTAEKIAQAIAEREARARAYEMQRPGRDFRGEIAELVQQRGELRELLAKGGKLPQEVVTACVRDGVSLRAAYAEHEAREAKAELERVRQENEILRRNEKNAARAPVRGAASGGSESNRGKDPFLEGFFKDN